MDRIRLDIGALSMTNADGGRFAFLLCNRKGGKCLLVKLSRGEANTIIQTFGYRKGVPPIHLIFHSNMLAHSIELAEVNVAITGRVPAYSMEMTFVGTSHESRSVCSFTDGMLLAKLFNAPIYIERSLFEKYAVENPGPLPPELKDLSVSAKLHKALTDAIENEDYERAAEIEEKLNAARRLKNSKKRNSKK